MEFCTGQGTPWWCPEPGGVLQDLKGMYLNPQYLTGEAAGRTADQGTVQRVRIGRRPLVVTPVTDWIVGPQGALLHAGSPAVVL